MLLGVKLSTTLVALSINNGMSALTGLQTPPSYYTTTSPLGLVNPVCSQLGLFSFD